MSSLHIWAGRMLSPQLIQLLLWSYSIPKIVKNDCSVQCKYSLTVIISSPCCHRFNETFHFLFWTMFGVANQDYVDMPQFMLAEFVGRILYGIFTLVIVIVLLNMLIAMITNSFQKIEVRRSRHLGAAVRAGAGRVYRLFLTSG